MTRIELLLVSVLSVILLTVGSYIFGWHRGYSASEEKWQAEKVVLIAEAKARASLLESEGNRLRADLEVARANVRIEYVEVIREIQKVASSARRAIGPDLAGLLNSMSGIREATERVGADGTVEARRETTSDPARSGTSERALADWIAGAVKSHEECRSQANALIDYAKACSR